MNTPLLQGLHMADNTETNLFELGLACSDSRSKWFPRTLLTLL